MNKLTLHNISKLAYAAVTDWQRILRRLNEESSYRGQFYQPLREAIVNVTRCPDRVGETRALLAARARKIQPVCEHYSLQAFDCFTATILCHIARFEASLCGRGHSSPALHVAGLEVFGGPHMVVRDKRGNQRFLYIHPAKDWSDAEIDIFCEMLIMSIEQNHGGDARGLWFVDLNCGIIRKFRRPRKTLRARCADVVQLYKASYTHRNKAA